MSLSKLRQIERSPSLWGSYLAILAWVGWTGTALLHPLSHGLLLQDRLAVHDEGRCHGHLYSHHHAGAASVESTKCEPAAAQGCCVGHPRPAASQAVSSRCADTRGPMDSSDSESLPPQWSEATDGSQHHCVVCEVLSSTHCDIYTPFSLTGLSSGVCCPATSQPLISSSILSNWARGPPSLAKS